MTRKADVSVIGEFYSHYIVSRFNPATCNIETASEYLSRINREIRFNPNDPA
ncbi:hypothetical protein [Paenibacillus ehimensis]|uniref:hypothetical protein n=1 Tax=Paenibacillus ehimensis TaxID=79264 RepID=UPI0013E2E57E|nr:hypothetical protein [Paenibacillus ehimensis]